MIRSRSGLVGEGEGGRGGGGGRKELSFMMRTRSDWLVRERLGGGRRGGMEELSPTAWDEELEGLVVSH